MFAMLPNSLPQHAPVYARDLLAVKHKCNVRRNAAMQHNLLNDACGYNRPAAELSNLATGAAVAAALFIGCCQPALAGKTFLDLPECSNFKQAGDIQYCDVREGSGAIAEAGDLITVDFTAREMAGNNVYDGSRGFTFTVGQNEVVAGWEVAILGTAQVPPIKEGGIRTVYIPAKLAFGTRGSGCSAVDGSKCRVPPNTDVKITFQYQGLGY